MLLRYAKLAGGLRLLIVQVAPLVATSIGLLSARTVAYLVGFAFGNIASIWMPVVALLISVTGVFNAGANNAGCEAYRAQMRAIDNANRTAMASYYSLLKIWTEGPYRNYLIQFQQNAFNAASLASVACATLQESQSCVVCGNPGLNSMGCVETTCYPRSECEGYKTKQFTPFLEPPPLPPQPIIQIYPGCSSPNCPPGKKVWVQVLWGSPTGNFSDPKGCFLAAYSQDAPTLPVKIEYNPFLPEVFVKSQAMSYYLVDGDRFRGLVDNDWKNLESVTGWDKGYWRAEQTDSECRGWRPGWSRKIK